MSRPQPGTVMETGAPRGAILVGTEGVNRGLRIRILADLKPGHSGILPLAFEVLTAGSDRYLAALEPLAGEQFLNAREFNAKLRAHPSGTASKATFLVAGNTMRVEWPDEYEPAEVIHWRSRASTGSVKADLYRWRSKYGGMEVDEARRLRDAGGRKAKRMRTKRGAVVRVRRLQGTTAMQTMLVIAHE